MTQIKLYRQIHNHKFRLVNYKCKATLAWYIRFMMIATKFVEEEKVMFT